MAVSHSQADVARLNVKCTGRRIEMKKSLAALMMVAMFLVPMLTANAVDEVPIDSELAAAAVIANPAVSWTGHFWFTRKMPNGLEEYVNGRFVMNKDGFISDLYINEVYLDGTFGGLPENKVGICANFGLFLRGINAEGEGTGYGQAYDDQLKAGEPIRVVMHPYSRGKFLPFTCPEGVDPANLEIQVDGEGYVGLYDEYRGGFELWYNPSLNQVYQIIDQSTGNVLYRGHVQDQSGPTDEVSAITITYAGNPVEIFPDTDWENLDGQQFDGQTEGGAAKVYMADLQGQSLYLAVSDIRYPSVKISSVEADGSLSQICWWQWMGDFSASDPNGGWVSVSLPAGYGKVVITVTGDYLPKSNGFRFHGSLSSGGKG